MLSSRALNSNDWATIAKSSTRLSLQGMMRCTNSRTVRYSEAVRLCQAVRAQPSIRGCVPKMVFALYSC